ncbi:glutamate--tRNA ligase [Sulfurovum sp. XTW-4]|uniref:Glutamate--tRNA ligase n=1 Tax=Sulfurovum xiamenensis TaxID=3019066 RepID=A0ABT7QU51_9BACT|nr:glutamate--tRNA ligase [Sulfurovum xiamenensis]MDM5264615.1 glutamate--tRNA ligase [Sulfurovum xiamenensis]
MLRFAPSPTGDMSIEDLRIALFNYMVAKQKDVNFIVRIEDLDKERNITGKDTEIMDIIEKFALPHDSVSHQSENLHIHQTLAIRLLEEKKAFICTCTPEQLNEEQEEAKYNKVPYRYSGRCSAMGAEELHKLKEEKIPFVVRIKAPDAPIITHDLIKGDIETPADEVDSFVILNADGTPTYDFACACDDMISGISLVIRSEDQLSNTPKQIHIKTLLGYEQQADYTHLPMILNAEGKKMSTNDDASSVKWLFEHGFIPDAIANYLILLGNQTPSEIFTMPEALKWFDLSRLSKSPVIFDIDTLRSINAEHLKQMDDKRLSTLFGFADADIGKLAKLYLQEACTINELESKIKPIFAPKNFEGKWSAQMHTMEDIIQNAPMINDFNAFKAHILKESGLEGEDFFTPLRLILTGAEHGPELSEIYPLIKPYLLEVAS